MLSIFLQREKVLHDMHYKYDLGDTDIFPQVKEYSFLNCRDLSKYRSFYPELLAKILSSEHSNDHDPENQINLTSNHDMPNKPFQSTTANVTTGPLNSSCRIIIVETNSKEKPSKNRRKEDALREKILNSLQSSVRISMSAISSESMPVLASDLSWIDMRGLSTALSVGHSSELLSFLASKSTIKRSLKSIIGELRRQATIILEASQSSSSAISSSYLMGSNAGISSPALALEPSQLFYAMLYSTKDDRFELVSYTYSIVSSAAA